MRIHHLNCGTHCPLGGALFDGVSRGLRASIPTHCLLIETNHGLVLIDTGYGLRDVSKRQARLSRLWPAVLNVQLREEDTARRQIEALGYSASDVRHIVLTHLDFDHAGGLDDFPEARIHVRGSERDAAEGRRGFVARQRYRPAQWNGAHEWRSYPAGGERWHGFDGVRRLDELPPEILLVPLEGHTAAHSGVAIRTGDGWLLHAGDAYLFHGQLALPPRCPWGLAVYQAIMDTDRTMRRINQQRLRELKQVHGDSIRIICSHDASELAELRARDAEPDAASRKLPLMSRQSMN